LNLLKKGVIINDDSFEAETTNSDLSLTDERGSLEFILKYQF